MGAPGRATTRADAGKSYLTIRLASPSIMPVALDFLLSSNDFVVFIKWFARFGLWGFGCSRWLHWYHLLSRGSHPSNGVLP